MTLEAFGAAISALNLPAIYGYYKDAQSVPYISYTSFERNVIHADGIVIYGEEWIELRLVTKSRNLALEKLVENVLTSNGISFDDPDFDFDEKQNIHTASYSFMLQN